MRAEPLIVWSSRSISSRSGARASGAHSSRASTQRATLPSRSRLSSRKSSFSSRISGSMSATARAPRQLLGVEEEAGLVDVLEPHVDDADEEVDLDLLLEDRGHGRERLERRDDEAVAVVHGEGDPRPVAAPELAVGARD